jgi:hypothetical protein
MEPAEIRTRLGQVAEDLSWLEQHAAAKPDGTRHRSPLRLAAALVRNLVAPFVEDQPPLPLHIAVVGGAGAGKSTVANLLIGELVAESNPQAGFTRHPIAFCKNDVAWPATVGFFGPLRRLERPESARLDEDVYQVRRLSADKPENELLQKFVVWDCPDMTTWAASHYVPRLLEVAGLADVLVYVASDERYNDEVPTEFLKLFLEAGKTVVVVLVKMREADAPAFLDHFRKEVGSKMPGPPLSALPIPQLNADELADPIHKAARFRIPIINQISVLAGDPTGMRRIGVHNAWIHLTRRQDRLLAVAREDLIALDAWRRLVQEGQVEFENRYRKEYLTSERFRRFDETLVRLLELLELPKIGQVVSKGLNLLRMPYTLVKGWIKKDPPAAPAGVLAEKPVMEAAYRGWIDNLRKEAAARKTQHPLWQHIHDGFQGTLGRDSTQRFDDATKVFHDSLTAEVERTARALLEDLEQSPAALNSLRGAKFVLDVGAITGGVLLGGFTPLSALLVPLGASISQYLVDLLGENYVTMRREETRSRQQALLSQKLSIPLAEWLVGWPTSGGSVFERLYVILRRLPANLAVLDPVVMAKLS